MAQPPSLIISAVYKLGFQWLTNPCRELALQGDLSEMADLQVAALLEMVINCTVPKLKSIHHIL